MENICYFLDNFKSGKQNKNSAIQLLLSLFKKSNKTWEHKRKELMNEYISKIINVKQSNEEESVVQCNNEQELIDDD